ncbi:MAG: TraR/DksA C4-type zinc finger protein [Moraxellaceae bacterium]|nr:TraR/DksA C4-type zinc finger protein [Moraxellaceae bacterium]
MSIDFLAPLLQLQQEYQRRINGIRTDLQHREVAVEADFAEQVSQRENDEVLGALLQEAEVELQRVMAAQERLASGTYGICVRCGATVAEARLAALPQADTCQQCAQ